MQESSRQTTVAAVSMVAEHSPDKNVEFICETVRAAVRSGINLVVFPECAVQGYPLGLGTPDLDQYEHQTRHAQPIPGPATEAIRAAIGTAPTVVALGMTERADSEPALLFNTVTLIGSGGIAAKYRKVHTGGAEKCLWTRGREWAVADTEVGRVGFLICYDLVFPEAARSLVLAGAEMLLLSTAWARSDSPTFERGYDLFTRCRALENQVFLVSANLVDGAGLGFHGHSRIVDPTGAVVAESPGPGMAVATMDVRNQVLSHRARSWFGQVFLRDRAPETYRTA